MALIVQKYGGTSMGTPERILNVARRVKRWHDHGHKVVVVVSAMSGETNRLLALAKAITETPDPRELDQMVSTVVKLVFKQIVPLTKHVLKQLIPM